MLLVKKMQTLDWVVLGVTLLTFLPGIVFYGQLPARMPIHWNLNGEVSSYAPKILGILLAPVISLFVFFYTRLQGQSGKNASVAARVIVPIALLGLQVYFIWVALK